jgi:hypothetical protein
MRSLIISCWMTVPTDTIYVTNFEAMIINNERNTIGPNFPISGRLVQVAFLFGMALNLDSLYRCDLSLLVLHDKMHKII